MMLQHFYEKSNSKIKLNIRNNMNHQDQNPKSKSNISTNIKNLFKLRFNIKTQLKIEFKHQKSKSNIKHQITLKKDYKSQHRN